MNKSAHQSSYLSLSNKFLRLPLISLVLLTLGGALCGSPASAAPTNRYSLTGNSDFALIGNTLGQECAAGTPAPVVGTIGACGVNTSDSSPDIFWRSDEPAAGQALADLSITAANARSTAVLKLPAGATVTYSRLYWAGFSVSGSPSVTFERPGAFGESLSPDTDLALSGRYQRSVDVTTEVQANGAGEYRVSVADLQALANANNSNLFASWYMVVVYRLATEPARNIVLFDGLDGVASTLSLNVTLSGFLVPAGATASRLGVVGFDGDNVTSGDSLFVNGLELTDAQNPTGNFFNSTRSILGNPESNTGDLPQLTGTPQSMSGLDLDIVDISDKVSAGDTSMKITASTAGDVFFVGAFVVAVESQQPDFTSSFTKTAVNKTRGDGTFRPGDQVEYTLTLGNQGTDDAVSNVLSDTLAAGITFVPGSLEIVSGANAGTKTDGAGDDQAEYVSGTRTVTFRLGTGADSSVGGTIPMSDPATVVRFKVTIDSATLGNVANQGKLSFQGKSAVMAGVMTTFNASSGDGTTNGAPTVINVTNPVVCGDGVVGGLEQCDQGTMNGKPGSCCSSACLFLTVGTQCRAADSSKPCDAAESCSGTSAACPPDIATTDTSRVCRPASGGCDVAETCDGSSFSCPADKYVPMNSVCRASVALCDKPELCDGLGPSCPSDLLYTPADHFLCRAATPGNDCSVDSYCTGTTRSCVTAWAPSGTACRKTVNGALMCGKCNTSGSCLGTYTAPADGVHCP